MKASWIETDKQNLRALRAHLESGKTSVEEVIELVRLVQRVSLLEKQLPAPRDAPATILRRGLRLFPNDPLLLEELAIHLGMTGGNSASQRLLRKALRIHKRRGDFDSADRVADRLASDYFFEGIDALDAGDHVEAEKLIRKAIQTYPLHADSWGHIGIIHEEKGDFHEAGRCYWQAVKLGRIACHETEMHDRWVAKITRSPSEAKTSYWGKDKTRPYLRAIYNWAQLLYQRKDFKGALAYSEESLIANPNDNTGARYLAYSVLRVLGRKSKMTKLARQYRGESLSNGADQLETRCFGRPIHTRQRTTKPN